MITMFNATMSRSSRLLWLLEELEAEYQLTPVTIRRPDGSGGPDRANPHPLSQVPCILDDGELLTESLAIWLHVVDKHPQAGLAPTPDDPRRAAYIGWMGASVAVLEPVALAKAGAQPFDARMGQAQVWLEQRIGQALSAQPWLLGEAFSAVDVAYASLLLSFRATLAESARTDAWLARCRARPALARARAKDALSS